MIEHTIEKLEERLRSASLTQEQRSEAERLLHELKTELARARKSAAPELARGEKRELREDESALDLLSESVTGFEASHPRLVGLVNRISTVLANMGI